MRAASNQAVLVLICNGWTCFVQNPETRHRKEDIVHPLRQITTNPMKKGGYGFNKTTLSERKGYKGVVSTPCTSAPNSLFTWLVGCPQLRPNAK